MIIGLVFTGLIVSGVSEPPINPGGCTYKGMAALGRVKYCVYEVKQTPIYKNTIRFDYPAYEYYVGNMDLYPDVFLQELPKTQIPADSFFLPLGGDPFLYLVPQSCVNGEQDICKVLPWNF